MFHVRNLTDCAQFNRAKLLNEVFHEKSFGELSGVWTSDGHLYVALNDNLSLFTFDKIPESCQQGDECGWLDVQSEVPIVQILFPALLRTTVFVVYTNGLLQIWNFSDDTYNWCLHGNVNLIFSEGGSLTSVVLHKADSTIYWCERSTKYGKEDFTLGTWIPRGLEGGKGVEQGTAVILLTHIPQCTLYSLQETLLLWPSRRSPCPPGVYVKWQPPTQTIGLYVESRGLVLKESTCHWAVDFKEMAIRTASFWAQSEPITARVIVTDPTNQRILCIDHRGHIHAITDKDAISEVCKLSDWSEKDQSKCHGVVFQSVLFITSSTIVRVFSLSTGGLIQQMAGLDNSILGTMATCAPEEAGLFTKSEVYYLQMTSVQAWWDAPAAPSVLYKAGRHQQAVQQALESVYSKEKSLAQTGLTLEQLLQPGMRPQPSLLVVLLHKLRCHESLDVPLIATLSQLCRKHAAPSGGSSSYESLFEGEEPYVQAFCELEGKKLQVFSQVKVEMKSANNSQKNMVFFVDVEEEVRQLLTSGGDLDVDPEERHSQYAVLSRRYPRKVLEETLRVLGPHKHGQVNKAALTFIGGFHDNSLLPHILRVIYIEQPDKMLPFLETIFPFGHQEAETATKREPTQGDRYRQILQSLPQPEQSKNVPLAAMATVQVMLRSKGENCEFNSLNLLMKHRLWRESVQLVERQPRKGKKYRDLYMSLLSTTVREGVFPTHSSAILSLTPELMSISLMRELGKLPAVDALSVYCIDPRTDLALRQITPYLLARLNME